ncbi:MAG: sigma factor [Lachnospiraceae bacterium]
MRQPVQELIERYQKNLYAAAFNICKNQMDAEDVVQETLVQYYTTKKEFESEQHIGHGFYRLRLIKQRILL